MATRSSTRRRSTHYSLLAAIAAISLTPAISFAQPALAPTPEALEIATSNYTFVGEVNADGIMVRSGASENDYPVLKLSKGAKLTVVGTRFEWLKVEPPEGSFCLVSQAFVDKRGDGTVGRIINNTATVRIGSALVPSKMHKVPTLLEPGTDVQITGELQEFYKIAPPKGVYFYVEKKFVDPLRRIDAGPGVQSPGGRTPEAETSRTVTPTTATPGPDSTVPTPLAPTSATPGGLTEVPTAPGTETARTPNGVEDPNKFVVVSNGGAEVATPTTVPSVDLTAIRALQDRLTKLEERYAAAGQQEISQQPIDELNKDYAALLAEKNLPPNARKVAEARAQSLMLRKETLVTFLAARKAQEEAAQHQKELEAEQKELQDRVAAAQVKHYAAIGRLAQSSLNAGGQPLFRLVDPANGRTIIYVRAGDVAVVAGLNQFIAITGKVVTDDAMRLTYVQPSAYEVIDPKQVNTKVFADYAPPSLNATNVAGTAPGME